MAWFGKGGRDVVDVDGGGSGSEKYILPHVGHQGGIQYQNVGEMLTRRKEIMIWLLKQASFGLLSTLLNLYLLI